MQSGEEGAFRNTWQHKKYINAIFVTGLDINSLKFENIVSRTRYAALPNSCIVLTTLYEVLHEAR
jgi:hypothetical protein